MAIMAVRLEDEASILMNEFFDYHGFCYALSAPRNGHGRECAVLEDFYECTVQTTWLDDIPVIFVLNGQVIGWYKKARIYRENQIVSVFLEGNICAKALDAVLLPKASRISGQDFHLENDAYEIIENDDARYERWMRRIKTVTKGLPVRYELADTFYSQDKLRLLPSANGNEAKLNYCLERCTYYAKRLMEDHCPDIREPKTMLLYARKAVIYSRDSVDAWYYQAMACEQLGFVKDGLKAIEKALAMEPDADDLMALKGHLLFEKKDYQAAAECYEVAWQNQPLDAYLIHLGQTWFAAGNVDAAYKAFKRVQDKTLLEEHGINLKDMERRWPFVALRGLFGKIKK